jgi:hypothetical protein
LTEKLEYAKEAKVTPMVIKVTDDTGFKKKAAKSMQTVCAMKAEQLKYLLVCPVVQ